MGRLSWVSLNADRLPSAGLLHYSIKKAFIKAQATLSLTGTGTGTGTLSEIEFNLNGHVPLKGRIHYWTRTKLNDAPARDAAAAANASAPNMSGGVAFILNQAGATPSEVAEEHEFINGVIRLTTASLEAPMSLALAPNTFLLHSPLSLLIGLISEVANVPSVEATRAITQRDQAPAESLPLYKSYFLAGTKLYAFEAVEVGRGSSEALLEARWQSLGAMNEETVREHTWPQFDWSESAPLALTIDFERRILVRAGYRAPFFGSVTLEFAGAEPAGSTLA